MSLFTEDGQNLAMPVVAADLFWSLFMHKLPDYKAYVQHKAGFTLHYGDPAKTPLENTQIDSIVNQLFHMASRTSFRNCAN